MLNFAVHPFHLGTSLDILKHFSICVVLISSSRPIIPVVLHALLLPLICECEVRLFTS